ncbi:MAG: hypothetical protein HW380_2225 [Magnetococcales bacterium]|nr:hypothetical protein [Magnetococcales bacterium]
MYHGTLEKKHPGGPGGGSDSPEVLSLNQIKKLRWSVESLEAMPPRCWFLPEGRPVHVSEKQSLAKIIAGVRGGSSPPAGFGAAPQGFVFEFKQKA